MRPDPQYAVQLSVADIPLELPIYPIYGVTPSDKYIPIQVDNDGKLSIGDVTITGPVTVSDVIIKGVDPDNGNTSEDFAVYNLGSGNGYSMRSTLFDGGNHLAINPDGSINATLVGSTEAIPVTIDHSLDSVAIYGTDGSTDQFIKTDSSGNLQVGIVGTPTINIGNTPLAVSQSGTWNINNISGSISLPTGASTSSNQINGSQKTQIVDGSGNVIASTSNALNVDVINTVPVSGIVTTSSPAYSLDLFGRARISNPVSLFSAQFLYNNQPLLWDQLLAGSGTSTFNSGSSTISLAVTSASGDRVVRQTKEYFAYEPDRAEQGSFTFVFGTGKTNCIQRVGLYDDNDGVFVQLNGTTFSAVIRSSVSGSPVDTVVIQSNFTIDKLDGTGPSGIVLDVTKVQLIFIEYQWFGVGSVRFGIFYNTQIYYFTEFFHANIATTVYMLRGSLPVRYEIVNTGTTSGSTTLTQICCAVQSEAGYNPTGINRAIDTGTSARAVAGTGSLPLISIRLKAANNRATIIPTIFSIITDAANNFRYQVILNGTLTGASFNSVSSTSLAEFDITATALTGGTILSSGYVTSVVRQDIEDLNSLLKLVSNISGVSDIITLYVSNISSAVNYYGSLEWQEFS